MTQAILTKSDTPPGKMTYEEFLRSDHGSEAVEWENGEVRFMTVSFRHNELFLFLANLIQDYVEERQNGAVFVEPFQMKTGPNLPGRAPDIGFLVNENRARIQANHVAGPADLVIEIVSPESVERDYITKYAEYEQGGVQEYWIVDPLKNEARFYLRDANGTFQETYPDGSGVYHSVVMEGFWIKTEWLWQNPLPPKRSVLKALGLL